MGQTSTGVIQNDQAMLSPPSQADKSDDRSRSVNSQGSHVGKNKVFVPHLSFPDDINVDPREKRKVHQKPKGEARYNLKKSTTGNIAGGKKGYGKKAKLLEFSVEQNVNSELLEEPMEVTDNDRLPAARGGRATATLH